MNFIGHATVALWQSGDPAFVLGSMLPDFAGMARARLGRAPTTTPGSALSAGIALHHRTDDVFHGDALFTGLSQRTLDELCAAGVPRGTARAVAHIGAEMLLDGELVRAPEIAEAYMAALQAGSAIDGAFCDPAAAQRWQSLRTRLLAYGTPYEYGDPDAVLARLEHVLRGRPRLALEPPFAPLVREALPALQQRVVRVLPALLESVREALR